MRRILFALMVLAVVASSCSSNTDSETTTTAGSSTGSTAAVADTTTTNLSPDTTDATTTTQQTTESLDACVVGTWVMDSAAFFEQVVSQVPPEDLDGEFLFVDGRYILVIGADGSFESIREDWSFAVSSDLGELEMTINDSDVGRWTLDGDVLSTSVTPGDPPDISILIDGVPFDFPGGATPFEPPAAEFTGAVVQCDGANLTATADGFSSTWARSG